LDINMPRMSGIEALSVIKKNEKSKTIPVVMLEKSHLRMEFLLIQSKIYLLMKNFLKSS